MRVVSVALSVLLVMGAAILLTAHPIQVRYEIPPDRMLAGPGFMYLALLPSPPPGTRIVFDTADAPAGANGWVTENGNRLGEIHKLHADIIAKGRGRASLYAGYIYFSSSDNSDPRNNGRIYSVTYEIVPSPIAVAGLCIAICLLIFLRFGRVFSKCVAFGNRLVRRVRREAVYDLLTVTAGPSTVRDEINASVATTRIHSLLLVLASMYAALIASGIASFLLNMNLGMADIFVGRATLLLQIVGFPLAAVLCWPDRIARRFFISALLGAAIIIVWLVPLHLQIRDMSVVNKSLMASLWQAVGYGTLFVMLRNDRILHAVLRLVLLVSVFICIGQVIYFGVLSDALPRSFGLYQNPNIAALAIGLLCFSVVGYATKRAAAIMLGVSAVAVLATLSRSGIFAFTVAAALSLRQLQIKGRVVALAVCVVLLGALCLLLTPESHVPSILNAAKASIDDTWRLAINIREAMGPQGGGWQSDVLLNSSGMQRVVLFLSGWHALMTQVGSGYGLDYAFELAPHNTFLLFAIAAGAAGAIIPLLWFSGSLAMFQDFRAPRIAFIVLAMMFSHDVLLSLPLVAGATISSTAYTRRPYRLTQILVGLRRAWLWIHEARPALWKSAGLVSSLSALSIGFGFVRTAIIAAVFGASYLIDAYYLALIVPIYLATVAVNLLQVSFLPFYSRALSSDAHAAAEIRSSMFWLLAIVAGAAAVVCALSAPWFMPMLATPNYFVTDLAVSIVPLVAAIVVLNILSDFFGFVLNAHRQFVIPAAAPAANALIASVALIVSRPSLDVLAIIFVLGSATQLVINLIGIVRLRAGVPLKKVAIGTLRPIGRLIVPALPSVVFSATTVVYMNASVAKLGPGSLAIFGYAWRLYGIPSQIFILSLATVLLPHFSHLVETHQRERIRTTLSTLAEVTYLGSIFIIGIGLCFGTVFVQLLLGWGHFTLSDAEAVNTTLLGFLAGLFFFAYGTFLSRYLAAQYKTSVLSISSFISFSAVVIASFLFEGWATAERVSLSLSVGYLAATMFMQIVVSRLTGQKIAWRFAIMFGLKAFAAVGVALLCAIFFSSFVSNRYAGAFIGTFIAAVIYLWSANKLGLTDIGLDRLVRPALRRLVKTTD